MFSSKSHVSYRVRHETFEESGGRIRWDFVDKTMKIEDNRPNARNYKIKEKLSQKERQKRMYTIRFTVKYYLRFCPELK